MPRIIIHFSAALALSLTLISAAPASAAGFQPPTTVSAPGATQQQVAINAQGAAVIVWRRHGGTYPVIQARRRSAAGVYGPVTTLSPALPDTSQPRVAINRAGDVFVVWSANVSGNWRVYARVWPANGAAGAFKLLYAPGVMPERANPDVAVGDSGPAVVVWQGRISDPVQIRIMTRTIALDGALGPIAHLSNLGGLRTPANAGNPHVTVAPNGAGLAVWEIGYNSYDKEIQARLRATNGSWGPIQQLTPATDCPPNSCGDWNEAPEAAINARGDALVAWRHFAGSYGGPLPTNASTVLGRFRPFGGGFAPVQRLSAAPGAGMHIRSPRVGVDRNGGALVVWGRHDTNVFPATAQVQARARGLSGALGPIQNLSPVGDPTASPDFLGLRLAMNPSAYTVVVWHMRRASCNCGGVFARVRLVNGSWAIVQNLSPPAAEELNPVVGVNPVGTALAAWLGPYPNPELSTYIKAAVSPNSAPTITITTPADGANYARGSRIAASYSCADPGGPGIRSCVGTVPSGAPIDTSASGVHGFTVNAADLAGNVATRTVHYTVP